MCLYEYYDVSHREDNSDTGYSKEEQENMEVDIQTLPNRLMITSIDINSSQTFHSVSREHT